MGRPPRAVMHVLNNTSVHTPKVGRNESSRVSHRPSARRANQRRGCRLVPVYSSLKGPVTFFGGQHRLRRLQARFCGLC